MEKNNPDKEKAFKALASSEIVLFQSIGYFETANILNVAEPPDEYDDDKLFEVGRQWFERRKEDLQELICRNSRIRRLAETATSDPAALVIAIADGITAQFSAIPPFLVAALIFKIGVSNFCKTDWSSDV